MGPTSKRREKGGRGEKGEGKKGKEKEGRGREWRVKMCCPMSNKLSPPMRRLSNSAQNSARAESQNNTDVPVDDPCHAARPTLR